MPVSASAGKALTAIWRYSRYNKSWQHVGYTYSSGDGKKVCDAYNNIVGTSSNYYSYQSSKYLSPKKWDPKWIAVFYQYGPKEWGRFLYGFNFEIYDSLREYYEDWEEQNNTIAASTDGKYNFDDRLTSAQSSMQSSSISCADTGRYVNSSGRCV